MKAKQKIFWIAAATFALGSLIGYYFGYDVGFEQAVKGLGGNQIACTQDAKLCPDGSYVGRVSPNCEFALCPGE